LCGPQNIGTKYLKVLFVFIVNHTYVGRGKDYFFEQNETNKKKKERRKMNRRYIVLLALASTFLVTASTSMGFTIQFKEHGGVPHHGYFYRLTVSDMSVPVGTWFPMHNVAQHSTTWTYDLDTSGSDSIQAVYAPTAAGAPEKLTFPVCVDAVKTDAPEADPVNVWQMSIFDAELAGLESLSLTFLPEGNGTQVEWKTTSVRMQWGGLHKPPAFED
jgi:hypothetical protein